VNALTQRQRRTIAIGALALVPLWLYPPWIHTSGKGAYYVRETAGYYFLFDTTQNSGETAHSVDSGRLVAENAVVCIMIFAAVIVQRPKIKPAKLMDSYIAESAEEALKVLSTDENLKTRLDIAALHLGIATDSQLATAPANIREMVAKVQQGRDHSHAERAASMRRTIRSIFEQFGRDHPNAV
jgi:hypothetical protein